MGSITLVVSICLTSLGLLLLLICRPTLRESTLLAPWWWAVASLLAVGLGEVWIGAGAVRSPTAVRLAAAVSTFGPAVAVLGAKRPQDQGWPFIVLSLWGILALPAFEVWFLNPGRALEMQDARGWFLWVLIGLGVVNWLPTRFAISALLLAAAQLTLLSAHLPMLRFSVSAGPLIGQLLGVLAIATAAGLLRLPTRGQPPPNRVWFDFRDRYGLVWGLRVAERFNGLAQLSDWDAELVWSGFRRRKSREESLPQELVGRIDEHLEKLLWRFVSPVWIDSRRKGEID